MNTQLRLIATCAFLIAAGCARQDPGAAPAAGPAAVAPPTTAVRPTSWEAATATPGTGHVATAKPTAPPAASSEAAVPRGQDRSNWAPLSVSLSATCVERGDELLVTATSTKNAGLGFAAGYSKPPPGQPKTVPDFMYFDHESNPTGTITWSFVIRPTIPYGPGVVKVVANGADGRGAFVALDIEVAPSC